MNNNVYISLGSNLGDCVKNLNTACQEIEALEQVKILAKSKIWQTEPQNFKEQNWFFNQIIALEVGTLQAEELLDKLMQIEQKLGRVRSEQQFSARTIDIDILLFKDEIHNSPKLKTPHPRMLERAFVLIPLQEIAFNLIINHKPLAFYLQKLSYKIEASCIWQS